MHCLTLRLPCRFTLFVDAQAAELPGVNGSVNASLGAIYQSNVNGVVGLSVLDTYLTVEGEAVEAAMCACVQAP